MCYEYVVPTTVKGERFKIISQPEYAYGSSGMGSNIPPNAVLTFEVEIVDVKSKLI